MTPSEAQIVQVLLADYPLSGLGTASSLARKARVSDPTVTRLIVKLGFQGFSDFQSSLLAEVEASLHSPLLMLEAKRPLDADASVVHRYLGSVARSLEQVQTAVPDQVYAHAVRLLRETRGRIVLLGGRFSRSIAAMLAGYLSQLRPNVTDLGALSPDKFDGLVDLSRRDLLIVFDYRRYQSDVLSFADQAAARGVRVILFTDVWLSPIARAAEVTLVASTEVDSPFDTLAPALAQMEALVAHAIADLGDAARRRIEAVESIRRSNNITLDARPSREPPAPAGPAGAASSRSDGKGAT